MNIISCRHCGVVIDTNWIKIDRNRENYYNEDGSFKSNLIVWHNFDPYFAIKCPVCKGNINTGEKINFYI
jgi:phage FluMu protein Com